jgi:hypothetical protein
MLGLQEFGHALEGAVIDQDRAQQTLLGFDIVRHLPRLDRANARGSLERGERKDGIAFGHPNTLPKSWAARYRPETTPAVNHAHDADPQAVKYGDNFEVSIESTRQISDIKRHPGENRATVFGVK